MQIGWTSIQVLLLDMDLPFMITLVSFMIMFWDLSLDQFLLRTLMALWILYIWFLMVCIARLKSWQKTKNAVPTQLLLSSDIDILPKVGSNFFDDLFLHRLALVTLLSSHSLLITSCGGFSTVLPSVSVGLRGHNYKGHCFSPCRSWQSMSFRTAAMFQDMLKSAPFNRCWVSSSANSLRALEGKGSDPATNTA